MPRSGRCRCGALLHFKMTDRGYKTRCPTCQAIVRLRDPAGAPGARSAPATRLAPPAGLPAEEGPPDFSPLGAHLSDAPVALTDIPAYNGPQARPPARSRVTWLVGAALAMAVAVGAATALLRL